MQDNNGHVLKREPFLVAGTLCPVTCDHALYYVIEPDPRAAARSAARAKPWARVTNSEMRMSSAIMCWFGLVWTFDLLADVIEFRGFFKINVKESVEKQIEIIKKP